MPMTRSLLEQIQQALTTQNLSGNQIMAGESATQDMARSHLFQQQLSVPQNPSYFPMTSHDHQYQAQVNQIQEYSRVREQITALLLMQQQQQQQQQQQGTTNAATSAIANLDFNSYSSMMQGHPAMAMMNLQNNHIQQGGGPNQPMAAAAAVAPAFNLPAQYHTSNSINMMFNAPSLAAASQSTTLAPQRSTNTPRHDAKEKRWIIRYEELRIFHAVGYNFDIVLCTCQSYRPLTLISVFCFLVHASAILFVFSRLTKCLFIRNMDTVVSLTAMHKIASYHGGL
jgi:hypothetical protein